MKTMKSRHLFVMALGITVIGGSIASTLSGPEGSRIEASIQNLAQRSATAQDAKAKFEPWPTENVERAKEFEQVESVQAVGGLALVSPSASWRDDYNTNVLVPYTGSSEPYHTRYNATYVVEPSTLQASATLELPLYHGCLGTIHWAGVPYVTVQGSMDGGTSWSAYDTTQYCQQPTHLKFLFNNQKHTQELRVGVHMQSADYNPSEACFTTSMDAKNAQYLVDTTCVTPGQRGSNPVHLEANHLEKVID